LARGGTRFSTSSAGIFSARANSSVGLVAQRSIGDGGTGTRMI
jgi:hypothetical protein